MNEQQLREAPLRARGHQFEDFEVGQRFDHHWGRTLTAADSTLFSTLTLHFNPTYFNAEYAREIGYEGVAINPLLAFNTVVGLSVEDLSEAGGPFLGIDNLVFLKAVYPGDTLYAKSVCISKRVASSGKAGPVTWHTQGVNQRGEIVLEYDRTNLVRMRNPAA